MEKEINIAGFVKESITDGPGIRFTLFVQGCPRRCEGCHNPQTQPVEGGTGYTPMQIFQMIDKNPLLSGVTLSGGEPFCQAEALLCLAKLIKEKGLELAVYSGYTFEEILKDQTMTELLQLCDTLVDGELILSQKSFTLKFKGSKNQRVIDVKKSLSCGSVVLDNSERWN